MKMIILLTVLVMATTGQAAIIADHTAPARFDKITANDFQVLRESYNIFYGHTSHGSQIMTGLGMLRSESYALYAQPPFDELETLDLGSAGSLVWEGQTRSWLDYHPETNMVMWSWCGGCSTNTEEDTAVYLNAMNQLELDYPGVIFIYMTGHLDGTGVDGVLYRNNNQIRAYCQANDKILFDFADIESWDPDGVYYPDETDACVWCQAWCLENTCPAEVYCAHSHCFNCYRKGKSFWWLLYQVSAQGNPAAGTNSPDMFLELSRNYPNPFNPSTTIAYSLPESGHVNLAVYDITGHLIKTLIDTQMSAGLQSSTWNGTDTTGLRVASGTYFLRLETGQGVKVRKVMLAK